MAAIASCSNSNNGGSATCPTATGCDGGSTTCPAVTACGGTLDGTWQIDSTCVSGDLVTALNSQMSPIACNAMMQSAKIEMTGTVTFAGGLETNAITTTMTETGVITPACASALFGITSVDTTACAQIVPQLTGGAMANEAKTAQCTFVGGNCNCSMTDATLDTTSTAYATSSGALTTAVDQTPVSYCVSGTSMLAAQPIPNMTGVTVTNTLRKTS